MGRSKVEVLNSEQFIAQFMAGGQDSLQMQRSPIQVFPLATAVSLLKLPTPLFRAQYNFLLVFSRGGGKQQVDNELFELRANDLLFIREGHLNAIQAVAADTEGYFIYMDSAMLPSIFPHRAGLNSLTFYPHHSLPPAEIDWILRCCELIREEEPAQGDALQIQTALLKAIFLKLLHAAPNLAAQPDRQAEIAMRFKDLLYENFRAQRSVGFYARELAVSENYLNRCLRQVTGKAPKQHINEVVIFHSQILLQDRSKDIAELAFELNFSDPSYFGRLFKQITGQTPSAYRDAIMHD